MIRQISLEYEILYVKKRFFINTSNISQSETNGQLNGEQSYCVLCLLSIVDLCVKKKMGDALAAISAESRIAEPIWALIKKLKHVITTFLKKICDHLPEGTDYPMSTLVVGTAEADLHIKTILHRSMIIRRRRRMVIFVISGLFVANL